MCGIFGVWRPGAGKDEMEKFLEAMAVSLSHRGSDGKGFFIDGNFGMGSVRLAVIDPSGGNQPIVDRDRGSALAFNGEIYNYIELKETMKKSGASFRTRSDTEVLFESLVGRADDALLDLNGIFAFSFFHKEPGGARRTLFARDRLGVKPLYYIHEPGAYFAYASEIKAILTLPFIKREPNWDAIREYLFLQLVLEDKTFFSGIRQLLPGHKMELELGAGNVRIGRYWDIPVDRIREGVSEDQFADELESLLVDSMRFQMRSDVPIGATLSGGLDSSLVAALASRADGNSIPAYSGRFPGYTEYDEGPYIEAVLGRCRHLNGVNVDISPDNFLLLAEKMVRAMDYPQAGPGLFPQMCVAERASGDVKVLLGGQGGDELFGGYVRYLIAYLEFAIKGGITSTANEGKQYAVTLPDLVHSLPQLENYLPLLKRFWSHDLMGDSTMRYWNLIDRRPEDGLLRGDFLSRDEERVTGLFRSAFEAPALGSFINRMTHWDLRHFLPALLHVEDRSTMAFSLESRVPLLDHRIVEFVFQVPPVIKFRKGRLKHLYRVAVGKYFPEMVRSRRDKKGFPIPFSEWFAVHRGLRDHVSETIIESDFLAEFADREALSSKLLSGGRYDRTWWAFYNLAEWSRLCLNG